MKRIDFLKNHYTVVKPLHVPHDSLNDKTTPSEIIDVLASYDPTKTKKYLQWLIEKYIAKQFRLEDGDRITRVVSSFHKYKAKLGVKDINQYNSLTELTTAFEPYLNTGATRKEETARVANSVELCNIKGKHELAWSDDNIRIYRLLDKETSIKFYASKTAKVAGIFPSEWCTASPSEHHNPFDSYIKQGNLFVIHELDENKSVKNIFQYHVQSAQFMDVNDDPIIDTDNWTRLKPLLFTPWKEDRRLLNSQYD